MANEVQGTAVPDSTQWRMNVNTKAVHVMGQTRRLSLHHKSIIHSP